MTRFSRLLDRLLAWLGLAPAPVATSTRPRRLRATCEHCGKDLAVVRTTGRVWKHVCGGSPVPDDYRGEDGACVQQVVPSDAGMEGRR